MKIFFLLSALAFATVLLATPMPVAHRLSGRVVDAVLNLPLEYATVSALNDSGTLVDGTITDSLGRFELILPKGDYTLRFAYIGYLGLDSVLTLKQDRDLGNVKLRVDAVNLDEATVTAQRSQLTLKLDKQIYDVGSDILSRGGSANQVLENVPSIDVSPEGVVSLRGNEGVKVLINGKPSAMADNNALGSIPAANIARIEIMTSPSARYAASGTGGIINIILKDNTAKNIGGQVSATVGLPTELGLNASFSASQNKWTVFGNGGVRYSQYYSTGNADRTSQLPSGKQILREDLVQNRTDKAWNGFAGFDYRPTEATMLSASYSHYFQLDDDRSDVTYLFSDGAGQASKRLQQTYLFKQPGHYNQIEASLSHNLNKLGHRVFLLFQNDFWISPEDEKTLLAQPFPVGIAPFNLNTTSNESSTDYLLQIDYEQPLGEEGKKGKLEFGVRGEARIIASDYLAETIVDGQRAVYLGFDNEVDYYERIGAAYAQYAYEGDKWGLQLGLRDEYTYVRVEQRNGEADILKKYNNVFPSATISRKFGKAISANMSYTSRIRRPGFWAINPFGGVSNPNELELGNADINPSTVDAVQLTMIFKNDKLTINPYTSLSYVYAPYDTYATQDSSGLVRLLTINLDRERQLGGGLTATYTPHKDWSITGEGSLSEYKIKGLYEEVDFANSFLMKSLQLTVKGKLWKGVQAQATFDYWGGQRYAQFYQKPVTALRAGLSRQFLDDRLQLSLNVRNLFDLQQYRGGSQRASFTSSYARIWQRERWQLTAAWDLGKEVRMRKARGSIR